MSKAKLKKALLEMSAAQMKEIVLELYDARPEAREYLEYWLDPDPEIITRDYLEKAEKMFFTTGGTPRRQPTQTELKRLVKDFSGLVLDSEREARLLVHILIMQIKWINIKRPAPGQTEKVLSQAFNNAKAAIEKADLEDRYAAKLEDYRNVINFLIEDAPERKRGRGWRRW